MVYQYNSIPQHPPAAPTIISADVENCEDHQRTFGKGRRKTLLVPLVVAAAVLAVTYFTRRTLLPGEGHASGALSQRGRNRASVALQQQVTTDTYDAVACADPSNFVMQGVDLVAFFSLHEDDDAVIGSPEYASMYEGYRFMFSSAENKELFEVIRLALCC